MVNFSHACMREIKHNFNTAFEMIEICKSRLFASTDS